VHVTDFNITLYELQKHQNYSLMQLLITAPELVLEHLIVSAVLWQQCQCFTGLTCLYYHGDMKTSNKTQLAYLKYQPV
jgi:hypothetical protein